VKRENVITMVESPNYKEADDIYMVKFQDKLKKFLNRKYIEEKDFIWEIRLKYESFNEIKSQVIVIEHLFP
jgi:hypothetical protein